MSAYTVPGAVPRSWAISEAAPVQGGDKDLPSITVWSQQRAWGPGVAAAPLKARME